jgi:hypothetical protein
MILLKGVFTDILNTFNVCHPHRNGFRTQACIDAYQEAVMEDMLEVTYQPLNRGF